MASGISLEGRTTGQNGHRCSGAQYLPFAGSNSRPSEQQACAALSYQILQAFSRTMASPFLHPKAAANWAMLESGPLVRNLGRACGLVLAASFSASGRMLNIQT